MRMKFTILLERFGKSQVIKMTIQVLQVLFLNVQWINLKINFVLKCIIIFNIISYRKTCGLFN